ncbi:BTAD domain-containing putative transcriptional regulator [Deinococcus sp.]|uniref:BTAD domain-containing putative transcriptional regulator n=1 Tax=Deinococcus sp. TaxID=47478 RepID=UPI003CC6BE27
MTVTPPPVLDLITRSADDASRLYLHLLGEVRLFWAGVSLPLPGPKPLAVVAYLHLKGRASREELAEVFWPDKHNALQNVRQALMTLRRLGGAGEWLLEDRQELVLAGVSDVSELRRLQQGDPEAALDSALSSDTLLGRLTTISTLFDRWLEEERGVLRATQLKVLQVCSLRLLESGQYDRARDLLHQAMFMEGDSEATYRTLMLLEHRAGRTAQALQVFEECRRMLEGELGLTPETETLDLLQQIEDRQSGSNQRGELLSAEALAQPDAEPWFGRHDELSEARALLQQAGRVLVQGLAGLGKTRLARELAGQFTPAGGQVAWLEVGGDSGEVIMNGLRDLLGAKRDTDLEKAFLKARVGLLVLDNAVNTYAAQQVLSWLPESVPVLVTSRLRLPNLPKVELSRLPRAAALELLRFHLPEDGDPGAVNQDALCALLGDHPFAIRLAARTLGAASGAEVVRALYDAPHDTVRVLLEQSVGQLDARAYEAYLGLGSLYVPQTTPELLARLLTRPEEEVTTALFNLVERGLLTRASRAGSDTVSFQMHDLTWHAAREHRAHLPHHLVQAVTGYTETFAERPDLLATDLPHLLGAAASAPPALLSRLLRAWLGGQYIAARGFPTAHVHLLQKGIEHAEQDGDFETASLLNGKYADISQALLGDQVTAIDRLLRAAGQAGQVQAWGRQATFLALAGQMEAMRRLPEAFTHLQAAHGLADRSGQPVIQARVRAQQAVAHASRQEFVEARALLTEARDLLHRVLQTGPGDHAVWAAYLGVLGNLGQSEMRLGNLSGALELKREVWRVASERDDRLFMARSAFDQGELLHQLGEPQEAMTQLRQAIEISQTLGAGSLESMARQLLQDIASVRPAEGAS